MTRIGVFGGSFDPPHVGHKALVQAALDALNLDEVWVIPVGQAVHKSLIASPQQRLLWAEKLFADMPSVRVWDWEVKQASPVPSIEMMRWLNKQLDSVPIWLMGMDAWCGLPSWVAYPEHQQWCNVAVFSRQGEMRVQHRDWLEVSLLPYVTAGHVCYVHVALPDISATQIRQDILIAKDVSTVLDTDIVDEIQFTYQDKGRNGENE